MVFITKGLYSGNTFKNIHKIAMENNFKPLNFVEIIMPGTDLLTYAIKEKTLLEKVFTKIYSRSINKKIIKFVLGFEKNEIIKKVYTKWYTIFDELIVKKLEIKADNDHKEWIKELTINKNTCTKCMKCVKGCPRNNINIGEKIVFGINCDVCLYCINNCPQKAINIGNKTIGKVKYSEDKINEIIVV
jgi:ferredoxin